MKIHIFIAHMGIGGSERVCVNLANEFAKKHEVHIVVLNLDNDVNTHLLDDSVKVHELGVSRLRYAALPMLRYIRKNKPKVMLVFGNEMAIIINKLKKLKLTNVKVVLRVLNNVNISLAKEDNVSPVVENYLKSAQKQMADMDVVVAQCKAMGRMIVDKGLVNEAQMRVIYNPVSNQLIEKVETIRLKKSGAEEYKLVGNQRHNLAGMKEGMTGTRITFIGRVDPQKQPDKLIEAFKIIKNKCETATLRIVGDGSLMEQTKTKVTELELSESVVFDGIRKDMEQVYADSDVVVLTSGYEGMPNALIEAIGCGIPVVSFDCPIGPSEIVEDGVNGFLVEQDDVEGFADKVCLALKQDWDRDIIKATCRKFEVASIAKSYEDILKKL